MGILVDSKFHGSRRLFYAGLFTTVKSVTYLRREKEGEWAIIGRKLMQKLTFASGVGIGIATIPLALNMIPQEFWLFYIVWKVWLFGLAPAVFLYLLGKE